MSPVITLRARLVAGGALLLVALTGCSGTPTDTAAAAEPSPRTLSLDLPMQPPATADRLGTGTGVSAALDALEAPAVHPDDVLPDEAHVPASSPAATPVAPVVQKPAPAPAPAPVAPTCPEGEAWDGEHCYAEQLPEEAIGGARCPDPAHVVVAIREDGSLECGPADDTVTP